MTKNMSMTFEGETLIIGGREYVGTVTVEAYPTDASFTHAFGTEKLTEVEFSPGGFEPDLAYELNPKQVDRAVSDWIDANEDRVNRAFDKLTES